MSKYVKNLIADDIRQRLTGVNDALLVNVIGLKANDGHRLRAELRSKKISVLVVKNRLAARAVDGTPLAGLFDGMTGSGAVCWGTEDVVSLAKEITKILKSDDFPKFEARGGMMDGSRLTAEQVVEVSKWPSRQEQLSLLVGQILSPGAKLASQLESVGRALASQIEKKAEGAGEEAAAETPAETSGEAPAEAPAAG
jgi:large subunit ribosomal protein L10